MSTHTLAFFRRNLPHWLVADKAYFVTLRLHGTLPKGVVEEMRREREMMEADLDLVSADRMDELRRRQFLKIDAILDGLKPVDDGLCHSRVGPMLMKNLAWLRERDWTVFVAVLMSTHAHILMRNNAGRSAELIEDLDAFKSFTGRMANKLTGKAGRYWARDGFDHWVRTPESFEGFLRYTVNNPVKAGLAQTWQDWPWTVVDETARGMLD